MKCTVSWAWGAVEGQRDREEERRETGKGDVCDMGGKRAEEGSPTLTICHRPRGSWADSPAWRVTPGCRGSRAPPWAVPR